MNKEYKILHLFCGIGGVALGFEQSSEEWKGIQGKYKTLCGIDSDLEVCQDFEALTGAKAHQMDLFSRKDYIDFHGKEPSEDWREIYPEDIYKACKGITPHVVFSSPPCKGFSGLLPEKSAKSSKYQALNNLTVRGIWLAIEAFRHDLPAFFLIENVPRIKTRGKNVLHTIEGLLRSYGYIVSRGDHDCGEIGGLGQIRKRFLLIARNPEKISTFAYEPPKQGHKTIGDFIGPLPEPGDTVRCGQMHRLPKLQWKTWVRLALIPAGGDWRDLEKIAPEEYRLEYIPRGGGSFGVQNWDEPSNTVTGNAKVNGSNAANIADPRLNPRDSRHGAVYQVIKWDNPAPCVTGTRFGSGAPAISDPRTGFKPNTHTAIYRVCKWDAVGNTVTGAYRPNNGALSINDPRLNCNPRSGSYGIQEWDKPGKTITGTGDVHSGCAAISDPRMPKDTQSGVWVIIAEDGTWHRPLTTFELAMLQGFPSHLADGKPFQLTGNSDAKWRERIGNAVPPPAAKVIGDAILRALLPSERKEFVFSAYHTPVWVIPGQKEANIIAQ